MFFLILQKLEKVFKKTITSEEINNLPQLEFDGKIHLIRSQENLLEASEKIKNVSLIGFDTESKPSFKKGQRNILSIVQFATDNEAFIIQLKNINDFKPIFAILEDENILKVGVSLHTDFAELKIFGNFSPKNFLDLQFFVKQFDIYDISLKKMAAIVLGKKISKRQQRSNWAVDNLSEAQIRYAAIDAWACVKIYQKLLEMQDKT